MNYSFIFWSLLIAYKRGNYEITSFASYLLMTLILQVQSIMQKMNKKSKNFHTTNVENENRCVILSFAFIKRLIFSESI